MFDEEVGANPMKWNPQHAKSNYEKDTGKSKKLNNALCCWRKQEFTQQYLDHINNMWIGDWMIVLGNVVIDDIIHLSGTY